MFDDPKTEYNENDNKTFAKFIYRFIDFFLTRNAVPFFGTISRKIRCFFARRISKGIQKGASIEKGAIIVPGVYCEKNGCIGINCVTDWGLHVGEHTMIGPNCRFFTTAHKRTTEKRPSSKNQVFDGYELPKPIYIGKYCWIGYNVSIVGGVNIGDGSTIGASAVVTHDVPSFSLAVGNPAVIKKKYNPPKDYQ